MIFVNKHPSFIPKLCQRIQLGSTDHDQRKGTSATQDDANLFHKIFPHFIWLLRDVVLALPKDCSNIKEYFLKRVGNRKEYVLKRVDTEQVKERCRIFDTRWITEMLQVMIDREHVVIVL